MAFAAVGGSTGAGVPVGHINGVPALPASFQYSIPAGGISLGGITVDDFGADGTYFGPLAVKQEGALVSPGGTASNATYSLVGAAQPVPYGWLVAPRVSPDGSSPLTVAKVTTIIDQGVTEANLDRSQIRLPLGSTPSMVLCVTDQDGNILGLYVHAERDRVFPGRRRGQGPQHGLLRRPEPAAQRSTGRHSR